MNKNYSKTLNLPKTEFSMRAGLLEKEPQTLAQWEKQGLYETLRRQARGNKPFILHDGPPYANGHIHIGHALNKVLKDIVVKAESMQGYDAAYVPGWDCHGLPIEHQLFKKLKKRKSDVDTLDFRKQAHAFAMDFVAIQKKEFQRLGVFGDWERSYLTLNREYEYWILHSFAELVRAGYVYRGLKPVNWCPVDETALAEAEVEYEEHTSPSICVRFQVREESTPQDLPRGKPLSLLVWTTTPWTLLANTAVAVHPQFRYAWVETDREVVIIESSLKDIILEKAGLKARRVLREVEGRELTALFYSQPFGLLEQCPVVTALYVTRGEGTGLVHTAPGHGQEDFETGLKYNLPVLMPVNEKGIFDDNGGKFKGQFVFKANDNIIRDLKERGLLLYADEVSHSYPHCWRCKHPIIFRATQQWFLKIDHKNLREKLITIIRDDVQWIPDGGQERIASMVALRPDWCLSRQRHWGVPIPALKCRGCDGAYKLYPEVVEHFARIVKNEGTDAWFERDIHKIVPAGFVCPDCGGGEFEKTYDILDVWFDSGVSHQAVMKPILGHAIPADLYLEGSDQHRGWFQSSLIPAVALQGRAPYRAVLTHGFVVDGEGRKMSKSMGNVIAPQDIIKQNGVDILRLWVASSNYHEDIRLSNEIIERLVDAYRKIRNTIRYILGNLYDFVPDQDQVSYPDLLEIDQWALYQLQALVARVRQAYNDYEFAKVYKLIYSFCNEELSGFYLDILKDRLYTSSSSSRERRSAQTVLFHLVSHLVRLLAPVIPFTAEEIFRFMPKGERDRAAHSVHLLGWTPIDAAWENEAVNDKFKLFMQLRPFVLKALEDQRRVGQIGSSLEARLVFATTSERDFDYLQDFQDRLAALLIVSQVEIIKADRIETALGDFFPNTALRIEKARGLKCPRCWNYRTLGQDPEYQDLCERCASAVRQNSAGGQDQG